MQSQYYKMVTYFLATSIFIVPILQDQSNLPLGWDLPKVHTWQAIAVLLIVTTVIKDVIQVFVEKEKIPSTWKRPYVLIPVALIVLSTLLSPYVREVEGNGFLISYITTVFDPNHFSVAIFGNRFREMGAITLLLISGMLYLNARFLVKSPTIPLYGFVASSIIQSIYAFSQFIDLAINNSSRIEEGMWVYGLFGQSNFYAGHIIIGAMCALYLYDISQEKWKKFHIIAFTTISLGIFVSFSLWAILTFVAGLIIYLLYKFAKIKQFIAIFTYIFFLSPLLIVAIAFIGRDISSIFVQRTDFWQATVDIYTSTPFETVQEGSPNQVLIGDGPDTLSYVYEDFGYFSDLIVDRSHNFYLDILSSFGVIGLLMFVSLLQYIVFVINRNEQLHLTVFLWILLWVWLTRSFVHTSSIVNLVDFGVILTLLLSTVKTNGIHSVLNEKEIGLRKTKSDTQFSN